MQEPIVHALFFLYCSPVGHTLKTWWHKNKLTKHFLRKSIFFLANANQNYSVRLVNVLVNEKNTIFQLSQKQSFNKMEMDEVGKYLYAF